MKPFVGFRVPIEDASLLEDIAREAGHRPLAYARYVWLIGLRTLIALRRLGQAQEALRAALDLPAPPPRKAA